MSWPSFSGRSATLMAATAAAPDEIPTYGRSQSLEEAKHNETTKYRT